VFVLWEMSWDTMVIGRDGQRLGTTGDVRDPRENERSHPTDGKWRQDKWEEGRSTDTAYNMRTKHIHVGVIIAVRPSIFLTIPGESSVHGHPVWRTYMDCRSHGQGGRRKEESRQTW
jgi:hypothetical protein